MSWMSKIAGLGIAACGAMLIIRQQRVEKTGQHWTFKIGLLALGLLALMLSAPLGVYAAAERRVQIGFVSFVATYAPLWVAADRGFFAQEGLDPELVFIGSAPTMVASMIDVTVLPTAFSQPLKARGYPVLLEFLNANIPLTGTSLIALKETAEQSPQLVERVLKGLLRALAFTHHPGNREAVTQTLARRLRVEQRGAEEAYRGALETLERKPYPSAEGLLNIRRLLARSNPRVATIQVEDVMDTRILRKLDESGFIDALYSAPGAR